MQPKVSLLENESLFKKNIGKLGLQSDLGVKRSLIRH